MAAEGSFLTNPTTWTTLAFFVVVGGIIWKGGKAVAGALDKRSAKIAANLDEAQRLREEAHELLAQYQRKQAEALKEVEEIKKRAEEEARHLLRKAEKDLEASLKRREQQAKDRIANLEAQAAAEIQARIATVATAATQRLLVEKSTGAKGDELVTFAISGLKGSLH